MAANGICELHSYVTHENKIHILYNTHAKVKKYMELTADGKKSCTESLIMTHGKYYSLAKTHNLGMRPP
jgi:hypothetical protein